MKTIVFFRHGEVVANVEGRLAGSRTDSTLTEKGRLQAIDAVTKVKCRKIDLIVASTLSRAYDTVKIIAKEIRYEDEIRTSSLFDERDFGSASKLPLSEAFSLLDSGSVLDAESVEDFAERAVNAVRWLSSQDAKTVLVVSHAGFGQMLGSVIEGKNPADFLQYPRLDNVKYYEFMIGD